MNQLKVSAGFPVNGGIPAGVSQADWAKFSKAVTETSYETDHAQLTGISALRRENLDADLRAVVAGYDHFQFFKGLKKSGVEGVLLEWMVQTSRGGQVQGRFNSESGQISANVGNYTRWLTEVKFLMDRAEISHAASQQALHGTKARALENENALVRLSEGANWACFYGDPTVAPRQFAGLATQIGEWEGGSNVVDLEGSSDINTVISRIFQLKAKVRQRGSFGNMTQLWTDDFVQNDIDANLFDKYRVELNAPNINYGGPVGAIKTSSGNVDLRHDIYMRNYANSVHPIVVDEVLPDNAPSAPTLAAAAVVGPVAGSKWTAARAGEYYFAAAAMNENGVIGALSTIQSATVADTGSVTLTVTPPAGEAVTGYAIYRSVQDPAAVPTVADLRLLTTVADSGAATTVHTDLSADIPGASDMFALNGDPRAIDFVQFQAPTTFPLAAYDRPVYTWAVLLYGALRLGLPHHHFHLKNYVPVDAEWQPFAA